MLISRRIHVYDSRSSLQLPHRNLWQSKANRWYSVGNRGMAMLRLVSDRTLLALKDTLTNQNPATALLNSLQPPSLAQSFTFYGDNVFQPPSFGNTPFNIRTATASLRQQHNTPAFTSLHPPLATTLSIGPGSLASSLRLATASPYGKSSFFSLNGVHHYRRFGPPRHRYQNFFPSLFGHMYTVDLRRLPSLALLDTDCFVR